MILGNMFESEDDVPKRETAQLSPEGELLIDEAYNDAMIPTESKMGLIDQQLQGSTPITGDIDSAIKQKYQGLLGEKMQGFRTDEKIKARDTRLKSLKHAQSALTAKSQVTSEIYSINMQNQKMLEAARSEALSSILGFAGMGVGMYAAGDPKKQKANVNIKEPMRIEGNSPRKDRDTLNDAPGMNKSMNYLNDLEAEFDV